MFPKDIKILIADDSAAVRTLIRRMMTNLQYTKIREAEDGSRALQIVEEMYSKGEKLDLIISDWNMPNMSGLDLLVRLKSDAQFSDISFLMITYENELSLVTLAISSGADEYI